MMKDDYKRREKEVGIMECGGCQRRRRGKKGEGEVFRIFAGGKQGGRDDLGKNSLSGPPLGWGLPIALGGAAYCGVRGELNKVSSKVSLRRRWGNRSSLALTSGLWGGGGGRGK